MTHLLLQRPLLGLADDDCTESGADGVGGVGDDAHLSHGTFSDDAASSFHRQTSRLRKSINNNNNNDNNDSGGGGEYNESGFQQGGSGRPRRGVLARLGTSLEFQIALTVLLTPVIGLVFVVVGLLEYWTPRVSVNRGDGKVLVVVGALFFVALFVPIVNLTVPEARSDLAERLELHADWLGPLLVYPIAAMYLTSIAITYLIAVRRQSGSGAAKLSRRHIADVIGVEREVQAASSVTSELVLLLGTAVGSLIAVVLRVCVWSVAGPCEAPLLFTVEPFRSNQYFAYSTGFWFLVFSALTSMILFAVVMYYQQLLQIEQFTYLTTTSSSSSSSNGGGGGERRRHVQQLRDLVSPRNLAVWVVVWTDLLRDVRERPTSRAFNIPTVVACFICCLGSTSYVIFDNINGRAKAAEFTSGCVCVAIVCATALAAFMVVTVRLEKAVDYQTQLLSQTQQDVQRQLDEDQGLARRDRHQYRRIRAKVNVLKALDVYMRASESRPKLIGLSLNTVRWAGLILGLVFMNASFLVLYVAHCFTSGNSSGSGGSGSK